MVQLRIMNNKGIQEFKNYISLCKTENNIPKPELNKVEYSSEFSISCDISDKMKFKTKLDLAKYLDDTFSKSNITREQVTSLPGIWTWIAYTWFEALAVDKNGQLKPMEDVRYIFSEDFRKSYRHLIRLPYDMLVSNGDDASMLFIYGPVNIQGDYIEQALSRIEFYTNKSIIKTFTDLYFDRVKMKPKRGAQSKTSPGNLRRLSSILKQISLTYDLYSCTSEEIEELLPEEFDPWKK